MDLHQALRSIANGVSDYIDTFLGGPQHAIKVVDCGSVAYWDAVPLQSGILLPYALAFASVLIFAIFAVPTIDRAWVGIRVFFRRRNMQEGGVAIKCAMFGVVFAVCAHAFTESVRYFAVEIPNVIGFSLPYYELGPCAVDPFPMYSALI
eukprot:Opistho-2@82108